MLEAILQYQFMQNALWACILASVVCGLIGVIIVEKKLIMMSGGIAHTAYGGVGLGYLCGFEPMIGAVMFSVFAALGIGTIKRRGGVHTDVIIALLWSLGMALGTAFIGFMDSYPPDMSSYLFGNILTVTKSDLLMMIVLTALVCLAVIVLFNDWKAYLFDDCFSSIIGMKTVFLEYLLLVLVALTVVVLIRVAGIILVIALLTAPAATASLLSNKLGTRMLISIALGLFYCISGLFISYTIGIASGATIIVFSVLIYCVVLLFTRLAERRISVKN